MKRLIFESTTRSMDDFSKDVMKAVLNDNEIEIQINHGDGDINLYQVRVSAIHGEDEIKKHLKNEISQIGDRDFSKGRGGQTARSIFSSLTGEQLRDAGMKKSESSANVKHEHWSDRAYRFLLDYTKVCSEFMVEDVRTAAKGIVPDPPSNRAWGSIVVKAAKNKVIFKKGFRQVKNALAHRTPATLWGVL